MKKTLLSIMTMAILASGSANAAETMIIDVTAEIPAELSLTKANNAALDSAKLVSTATAGEYQYKEQIKIKGNSTDRNFDVQITTPFSLVHSTDKGTEFGIKAIKLGTNDLQTTNNTHGVFQYSKSTGADEAELELVISATEPATKKPGTYNGVLLLEIAESA